MKTRDEEEGEETRDEGEEVADSIHTRRSVFVFRQRGDRQLPRINSNKWLLDLLNFDSQIHVCVCTHFFFQMKLSLLRLAIKFWFKAWLSAICLRSGE